MPINLHFFTKKYKNLQKYIVKTTNRSIINLERRNMDNELLEDTIELLTKQMLKNKFEDEEEKFVITKQELYLFAIKLIKTIKGVRND